MLDPLILRLLFLTPYILTGLSMSMTSLAAWLLSVAPHLTLSASGTGDVFAFLGT
jgi:hypothetical protein